MTTDPAHARRGFPVSTTVQRRPQANHPEPPRRQRITISIYFVIAGAVMAVWGTRLPSVQARLHAGPGALSLGLLGAAAGMLVGLHIGGRLVDRIGPHRLVLPAALTLAATLALLGLPTTVTAFIAACTAFGAAHGLLDVAMNVAAARTQVAYGRPILQSIHATYSIGALLGAGAASLSAAAGIPSGRMFLGTAAVLAALLVLAPALDPLPCAPPALATGRGTARPRAVIIALGFLALCSLLGEGAAGDWSAIHLHTVLHASTALSATAYALYSGAMAICRLTGDKISTRIGPVAHVRAGGLLAAASLGVGLLIPHPAAALIGWTLFGAGLAGVVPAAVTAASTARPHRAGRDIAAISTTGYVGMVAGPAAIGAIATATNLTAALALPAVLALGVAVAATAVRPRKTTETPA
ncbi:MFS transporter [Streptacidiphilus sp. EB103A]|uniref:MFS transporter n=1 Tax=Streptacidiphilus sp. EB103A TaxID=3156275 RepID=UPI00351545E9